MILKRLGPPRGAIHFASLRSISHTAIRSMPSISLGSNIEALALAIGLVKTRRRSERAQPMTWTDEEEQPSSTFTHGGQAERKSDSLGLQSDEKCTLLEGEMLAREARRKLARIDQARHIVTAAQALHRGGADREACGSQASLPCSY